MRILCINIILEFGKFSGDLIDDEPLTGTMPINFVSIKDHAFIEDVERIVELIDVIELCEVGIIIITAAFACVTH